MTYFVYRQNDARYVVGFAVAVTYPGLVFSHDWGDTKRAARFAYGEAKRICEADRGLRIVAAGR
jgi:hypothetical protein